MSQWAVERGEKIGKERPQEFLTFWMKELKALGQAIRKGYFGTPEGYDLLIKALDESHKTSSKEKRELNARILRGAIIDFEQKKYAAEEYLHLISDLTLQELRWRVRSTMRVLVETSLGRPGNKKYLKNFT